MIARRYIVSLGNIYICIYTYIYIIYIECDSNIYRNMLSQDEEYLVKRLDIEYKQVYICIRNIILANPNKSFIEYDWNIYTNIYTYIFK